jgi:hypothetical protein
MRFRLLVVFPLAWVAAFLLGDSLLHGTPQHAVFVRTQIELAKALSLLGAWAAARVFERGDYPRRAWLLIAACSALLLLRDLTLAPLGFEAVGARRLALLRGVLVVAANLAQVLGTWILARAWRRASLSLPGSRASRFAVTVATIALSLAFAGPAFVTNVGRVRAGDLTAAAGAASAFGDIVSLCLIAPLLLTALALRGGLIGWPWSLLTASYAAWLGYDAVLVGLGPDAVRSAAEAFRALGSTLGCSAGLAQFLVVRQLRRLAAP